MDKELLEAHLDIRTTDQLLDGVIHQGTWEGSPDDVADFWASPIEFRVTERQL